MKILVVDDEPDVAELVRMGIAAERPAYQVVEAYDGAEGIATIDHQQPDLVLLDLSLPGKDGLALLRELRDAGNDVPVIVLTAKALEADKVRGLEAGADDYITKPFSQRELTARVDAVLRRHRAAALQLSASAITRGALRIELARREVTVDGRPVRLTPTEYSLLYHLATNAGAVMTHRELLAKVWGPEYHDEVHYLKVYVARLRSKIERDLQRPEYIETCRGIGYRFPAAERTAGAATPPA